MLRWKSLIGLGAGWLLATGTASAQFLLPTPVVREMAALPPPPSSPATSELPAGPDVPTLGVAGLPQTVMVTGPDGQQISMAVMQPVPPAPAACCDPPVVRNKLYANFEFLYWATQGMHVVPMLTTGSGPPGQAGTLFNPNTHVAFGGFRMLDGFRPGFRGEIGYWCDDCEDLGFSGKFFFLGHQGESLAGGSDGSQVLAMPIILSAPGQIPGPSGFPLPAPFLTPLLNNTALFPPVGQPVQQAVYIGLPGVIKGTVDVNTNTQFLGGNLDARTMMTHTPNGRIELYGGYRYLFLGDSLNRTFDAITTGGGGVPAGIRFMGNDSWRTRNYFHGADVGMQVTRYHGPFSATLDTSVAMGVTSSALDTNQTRTIGTVSSQSNIYQLGHVDNSTYFGVVPEIGLKLGFNPTDHVRLTAGYNFIYWSRVRRAQDQFDGTPVTPNQPVDFWAQGWSLGLEARY